MRNDPVNAAFGASLRRLRAERKMSKAKLARLAGVTTESITPVENGTGGTTLATAGRIAAALGADLRDMITPAEEEVRRG
jgi:transcriptional regulator with XRE-family HTH domain